MKWQDKLTAADRKHISITTLAQFRRARENQAKQAAEWKTKELCPQCKIIAQKLGIE